MTTRTHAEMFALERMQAAIAKIAPDLYYSKRMEIAEAAYAEATLTWRPSPPGSVVPTEAVETLTDDQIKHMVDRFLGWKLPENFSPDGGIKFTPTFNDHMPSGPMRHSPVGTNLLDAQQADAMVRHMIDGLPKASPPSPPREDEVWRDPSELMEPKEHERNTVYLRLENGDVLLADASAYITTGAEYHASTGVYLGQSVQDEWSGYIGWKGDVFERDDAGWHCYRHPNNDETRVRVAVRGWLPAIKREPSGSEFLVPASPPRDEIVEALRAIDSYEVVAEASMVNQLFRLKNIARNALSSIGGKP